MSKTFKTKCIEFRRELNILRLKWRIGFSLNKNYYSIKYTVCFRMIGTPVIFVIYRQYIVGFAKFILGYVF